MKIFVGSKNQVTTSVYVHHIIIQLIFYGCSVGKNAPWKQTIERKELFFSEKIL